MSMPLSYANIYNHVEKTLSPSHTFLSLCHQSLSLTLFLSFFLYIYIFYIYIYLYITETASLTSRHGGAVTRAGIRAFFSLFCWNIILKRSVVAPECRSPASEYPPKFREDHLLGTNDCATAGTIICERSQDARVSQRD